MNPIDAFRKLKDEPGQWAVQALVTTGHIAAPTWVRNTKFTDGFTLLVFEHRYKIKDIKQNYIICELSFDRTWVEVSFPIEAVVGLEVAPMAPKPQPQSENGTVVSLAEFRQRKNR